MIELYMWEYPDGDETRRVFEQVDRDDPDSNPFADEETPDPTAILLVPENLYRSYVNSLITTGALEANIVSEANRWKYLSDKSYDELRTAGEAQMANEESI